jgi:tubby-related protein 1
MVMPVMTAEMKEEEARRRHSLSQELTDRGICPMFDPMEGAAPENRACFDVATVAPHDMRSFLHNPMPKTGGMLQCRIVRDRSGITNKLQPKYIIESDAGVFLMAAQKQAHNKTPNYAISMAKGQCGKGTDAYLGKLRSDVCGLQWMAYGPGLNPSKADTKGKEATTIQNVRDELVAVQYSASFWGTKPKGPRKMTMTIPRVQANGERLVCRTLNPQTEGLLALAGGQNQLVESFSNKSPKWNDTIGAYVLNFNKRVTEASVKNFQLVSTSDPDTVYLQFGKVGKDAFNVDFRHPISPFQAFAICLTAFDYKLGCE